MDVGGWWTVDPLEYWLMDVEAGRWIVLVLGSAALVLLLFWAPLRSTLSALNGHGPLWCPREIPWKREARAKVRLARADALPGA